MFEFASSKVLLSMHVKGTKKIASFFQQNYRSQMTSMRFSGQVPALEPPRGRAARRRTAPMARCCLSSSTMDIRNWNNFAEILSERCHVGDPAILFLPRRIDMTLNYVAIYIRLLLMILLVILSKNLTITAWVDPWACCARHCWQSVWFQSSRAFSPSLAPPSSGELSIEESAGQVKGAWETYTKKKTTHECWNLLKL